MKNNTTTDLGLLLLRVSLGLYLCIAGIGKIRGEFANGFGSFYRGGFSNYQPDWLPNILAAPYGYALPWLEAIVGALLVLGLFGRIAAIGGTLILASILIAQIVKFGPSAQESGGGPYNSNYIQAAAYLLLALVGCGKWALDSALLIKRKGKG